MLKNYLATALRSWTRYKLHSSVTITGLALGISCCLVILVYVQDELSYDKHFDNADRIVRLVRDQSVASAGPMAPALASDLAGIETAARLNFRSDILLTDLRGDSFEARVFFADSSFLDIFKYEFLQGDASSALQSKESLILTESAAVRHFGEQNPLGEVLTLSDGSEIDLTVTGVIKNIPENSHFTFEYLASFELVAARSNRMENWTTNWLYTYALLEPAATHSGVEQQLPQFFERHTGEAWEHFSFQKLSDIHLRSGLSFDIEPQGDMGLLLAFIAIAILVVLIASVNFANLSTSQASHRLREIGMRKTLGAHRSQLFRQFVGEAIGQTVIATIIGFGVAIMLLPFLNDLAGKSLDASELFSMRYQVVTWFGVLFVGILAGFYPAMILAGHRPVRALKDGGIGATGRAAIRRGLVLFQFVASAFLLLVTISVYRQIQFMQNAPLGFEDELTLVVSLEGVNLGARNDFVRDQLSSDPSILDVTLTGSLPGEQVSDFRYRPEGWLDMDDLPHFHTYFVDEAFTETMEIDVVSGRALSGQIESDQNGFLINETAAQLLVAGGDASWSDPVGKQIEFMVPGSEGWNTLKTGEVIGVISDFHYRSLHESIEPLLLQPFARAYDKALVKVAPGSFQQAVEHLESRVSEFGTGRPFEFFFLDRFLDDLYQTEAQTVRLLTAFSFLVLLIACLGILGLASISAQQRRKELGVRKVLGAKVGSLVGLFVREYALLVVVASVIAIPLSLLAIARWSNAFAYQAPGSVWMFVGVVSGSLIVAALTVTAQVFSVALENPVVALRSE